MTLDANPEKPYVRQHFFGQETVDLLLRLVPNRDMG